MKQLSSRVVLVSGLLEQLALHFLYSTHFKSVGAFSTHGVLQFRCRKAMEVSGRNWWKGANFAYARARQSGPQLLRT